MSTEYTTCRVEHRDYVPYDYIAIEFCDVDFMGKDARKYEREWHNIEFKKLDKREEEIKNINKKLEELKEDIVTFSFKKNEIEDEIYKLRKSIPILKRLFTGNTDEIKSKKEELKFLIFSIDIAIKRQNELADLKIELDKDKFYSQYELMYKIERYLKDNGFRIINSSKSGKECVDITDIWQKEYN